MERIHKKQHDRRYQKYLQTHIWFRKNSGAIYGGTLVGERDDVILLKTVQCVMKDWGMNVDYRRIRKFQKDQIKEFWTDETFPFHEEFIKAAENTSTNLVNPQIAGFLREGKTDEEISTWLMSHGFSEHQSQVDINHVKELIQGKEDRKNKQCPRVK